MINQLLNKLNDLQAQYRQDRQQIWTEIGREVRARRRQLEIPQVHLAHAVGCHKVTICRLEKGNLRLSKPIITRIAKFLTKYQ